MGDTVVFPARALWSRQHAVEQAASEVDQEVRTGRAEGLSRAIHRRRHSVRVSAQAQLGGGNPEAGARPDNGQASVSSANAPVTGDTAAR